MFVWKVNMTLSYPWKQVAQHQNCWNLNAPELGKWLFPKMSIKQVFKLCYLQTKKNRLTWLSLVEVCVLALFETIYVMNHFIRQPTVTSVFLVVKPCNGNDQIVYSTDDHVQALYTADDGVNIIVYMTYEQIYTQYLKDDTIPKHSQSRRQHKLWSFT